MPRWVLNGGETEILLEDQSGRATKIPALDIWDAEFDQSRNDGPGRPSMDLPKIRLNESFLTLVPELRISDVGSVRIFLKSDYPEVLIDVWPESDQLIVGDLWSALDWQYLNSLATQLSNQEIQLDRDLSTHQLMWLYWESSLDVSSDIDPSALSSASAVQTDSDFDSTLVNATLYPYQAYGAALLVSMADQGLSALLADEMGLGKTLQAIYLIAHTTKHRGGPCLVVVPSSTVANWQRELRRFAPKLKVLTHVGTARTGASSTLGGFDVVLTTFDLVVNDEFLLGSVEWSLAVVDEAQMIKNADAQRSQAVKSLPRRTSLAITGTPIENSLTDMWSIMNFVASDRLGSKDEFRDQFPDDIVAAEGLSKRIAPLVIRRMVAAVAKDLPARIDIPTPIYASDALADLYEVVRSVHGRNQLAALTRLRQVCACPTSVSDKWPSIRVDFPKYDRTMEIIAEVFADGAKALIFSSFTESVDALVGALRTSYPAVFVDSVDGRRSPADRQHTIDEFSNSEGPGVLVLNPKAAGIGLNIQAANHVIHFTPEWNPATVAQASARSHRRGQSLPVFIYYLYYSSTVEEVMMDRMEMKRGLQEAGLSAVSSEPGSTDIARALEISPRRKLQ